MPEVRQRSAGVLPALATIGFSLASVAWGAGPGPAEVETAREATTLLMELAAIPSESSDAAGVGRASEWLLERLRSAGLEARLLDTGASNPLVFAERRAGPRSPVVLFYVHYDTQPTGPPQDWGSTEGKPFVPRLLSGRWDGPGVRVLDPSGLDAATLPDARLYARGAADDKAPIVMHLIALGRWLRGPLAGRLHVKLLLDGEEEAGSPHIGSALTRYRDLLHADLLILCDGPMDAEGRPSVYLGTRGDMHMRLRVRTAALSAHSGNYGLLPNAAWKLSELLASMRGPGGSVAIEGFLDDVVAPTAREKEELRRASSAEPIIASQLGAASFEGDPRVPYYERLLFQPGLVINHLASGRPGNQIPHVAEALLEVRLVTHQDPRKVYEAVLRHVRARAPDAELEYLDGSPAGRMDPSDPAVARGLEALRRAAGSDLLVYPSLGGTLPLLGDFEAAGHRYIGLPLVNFDNNQHVANENLKVSVLPQGIALLERLYTALAER